MNDEQINKLIELMEKQYNKTVEMHENLHHELREIKIRLIDNLK